MLGVGRAFWLEGVAGDRNQKKHSSLEEELESGAEIQVMQWREDL